MTKPQMLTRPYVVLVVDVGGARRTRAFPSIAIQSTSFQESQGVIIFGTAECMAAGERVFFHSDKVRRVCIEQFGAFKTPEQLENAETALQTVLDKKCDSFRPIPDDIMPVMAVDITQATMLLSIYGGRQGVARALPRAGEMYVVIPPTRPLRDVINRTALLVTSDNNFVYSRTHEIALLNLG